MNGIGPVTLVAPVLYGVVKITSSDGYDTVADLHPIITKGDAVAFLRGELNFEAVQLAEFGQAIDLLGNGDDEIAFGPYSLRRLAEWQAEIFRQAG